MGERKQREVASVAVAFFFLEGVLECCVSHRKIEERGSNLSVCRRINEYLSLTLKFLAWGISMKSNCC